MPGVRNSSCMSWIKWPDSIIRLTLTTLIIPSRWSRTFRLTGKWSALSLLMCHQLKRGYLFL
jgi:hypothetical protein